MLPSSMSQMYLRFSKFKAIQIIFGLSGRWASKFWPSNSGKIRFFSFYWIRFQIMRADQFNDLANDLMIIWMKYYGEFPVHIWKIYESFFINVNYPNGEQFVNSKTLIYFSWKFIDFFVTKYFQMDHGLQLLQLLALRVPFLMNYLRGGKMTITWQLHGQSVIHRQTVHFQWWNLHKDSSNSQNERRLFDQKMRKFPTFNKHTNE